MTSSIKPREFWLVNYAYGDKFEIYSNAKDGISRYEACGEFFPASLFHVIEYSAFEAANKRIEELQRDLEAHKEMCAQYSELVQCRQDRQELITALEFYSQNWEVKDTFDLVMKTSGYDIKNRVIVFDEGKRARKALAKVK